MLYNTCISCVYDLALFCDIMFVFLVVLKINDKCKWTVIKGFIDEKYFDDEEIQKLANHVQSSSPGSMRIFQSENNTDDYRLQRIGTTDIKDESLRNKVNKCSDKVNTFMDDAVANCSNSKVSQSPVSILLSLPGGKEQALHGDFDYTNPAAKHSYIALLAIQSLTRFVVVHGGRTKIILIKRGDLLIGRGDLIHAGCPYPVRHVRLHWYFDGRVKNTKPARYTRNTYIYKGSEFETEKGRLYYETRITALYKAHDVTKQKKIQNRNKSDRMVRARQQKRASYNYLSANDENDVLEDACNVCNVHCNDGNDDACNVHCDESALIEEQKDIVCDVAAASNVPWYHAWLQYTLWGNQGK